MATTEYAVTLPDFAQVFEAAYKLRNQDEPSEWHREPSPGFDGQMRWHWHASQIGGCLRAAVLQRAGLATDGTTLNSEITFDFGHLMHGNLERVLKRDDDVLAQLTGGAWKVISVESGGPHADLPLKARPDAIFEYNDEPIVFDLKTESGTSKRLRTEEARKMKSPTVARPEHQKQITSGAMVAESRGDVERPVRRGLAVYFSRKENRNEWDFDAQLFDITPQHRKAVLTWLDAAEEAWATYEKTNKLPDRLPPEWRFGKLATSWKCTARGTDDDRGKYCAARFACASSSPLPWVKP